MLPLYAGAVLTGALVGTTHGLRVLPTKVQITALGVVLVVAGMEIIGVNETLLLCCNHRQARLKHFTLLFDWKG